MLMLTLTLTLTHAVAKANDKTTDRKVKITDRKVETDRKVMPMRGRKAIQRLTLILLTRNQYKTSLIKRSF